METVKVRRVGNSNVISLPRGFEDLGYVEGAEVVVESLPTGELLVVPAAKLRAHIRELGRQAIVQNREALDRLAAYDRGEQLAGGTIVAKPATPAVAGAADATGAAVGAERPLGR